MKEIAQEINNKNITKVEDKFFVNGKETDITIITMLMQSNNKLKNLSESKIQELIEEHFSETYISDNNITMASDSFLLEIKDTAILPNLNCEFLQPFRYCKDENGEIIYHIIIDNIFHKINQTNSGKILLKEALEYTGLHNKMFVDFENLLNEWSKKICELYNEQKSGEALEYIKNNIPVIILKKFKVNLKVKLPKTNTEQIFYKYVDFQKGDTKRITYIDYLEEVFETFGTLAIKETPIPQIYTNSLETPAYHFFDISPFEVFEEVDLSESWQEAFSKYTEDEKNIMLAWIWGVFKAGNTTRACLYNADLDGYTGKSALTKAIGKILGESLVGAIQKDSLSNQFGFAKVWDKRLIVLPDSKNPNVIRSEKIHQLLGDDLADIENKGQKSFTRILSSKVWINSNILPVFDSGAKHEDSRIIIVKPKMSEKVLEKLTAKNSDGSIMYDSVGKPVFIGDPNFSTNLCTTSATMLVNAFQSYKKLCPNNADFIIPESVREYNRNIQPTEIGNFETIFDNIVELDPEGFVQRNELYEAFIDFCKSKSAYNNFATQFTYSDFVTNYLEKNRKFKISRPSKHGRKFGYEGIKLKSEDILASFGITKTNNDKKLEGIE